MYGAVIKLDTLSDTDRTGTKYQDFFLVLCTFCFIFSANIERIAFTATIYDADVRRQNFGQVSNAYIRIVDEATNQELIRYDLGEDFSIETAVVVGELYKHNGDWKFNAIGSGFQGGLAALCGHYGIEVA